MDRRHLLTALAVLGGGSAAAADPLSGLIGEAQKALGQNQSGGSSASSGLPTQVSSQDGQAGIREALVKGATAAVTRVGRLDGYWGDGKIRIPLPGAMGSIQKSLKGVGLSGPLEDLHEKINRAAETAAPKAGSIFKRTISSMTVEDVAGVLRGGDTAGTTYLKSKTGDQLATLFHPPMRAALDQSGAFTALRSAVARHGAEGLIGGDPAESLTRFAVNKGLDGVFYYVGVEEAAIRHDPVKQTTSLLRKVFGSL